MTIKVGSGIIVSIAWHTRMTERNMTEEIKSESVQGTVLKPVPETYEQRVFKMSNKQLKKELKKKTRDQTRPRINEVLAVVFLTVWESHLNGMSSVVR